MVRNEVVFEGIVSEKPTLYTTEKNFKIATVLIEQEEVSATGDSKMNIVPFKAFGEKAEKIYEVRPGDKIKVTGKVMGRNYKDKNEKTWYQSDNTIKSFQVEKKAEGPSRTPPPVASNNFDDIPF